MKAARFYGERAVRIDSDVDPWTVGPTDVHVDVEACGICGSDLHEYEDPTFIPADKYPITGASTPIVIGHEFSGRVSEVGEEVTRLVVGDPVAVHPNIPCHNYVYCADGEYNRYNDTFAIGLQTGAGGFAESAFVPAQQVHVLPDGVDVWEGALVEPFAVGLHAVRRLGMRAGDTVTIFGCGSIGLTALRAARAAGAKEVFVSEPTDSRREVAHRLGADVALNPTMSSRLLPTRLKGLSTLPSSSPASAPRPTRPSRARGVAARPRSAVSARTKSAPTSTRSS